MSLREDRIAKGQCPNDGKEAAPYRLCYECRQLVRMSRALKRGQRLGVFSNVANGGKALWWKGPKFDDPEAHKQALKWATPIHLSEKDGRTAPRLRGMRVDVDGTLFNLMERIGRPCTTDELVEAWGKLRSKRTDPLVGDLARIIQAAEKRKRKALKLSGQPNSVQ